MRTNRTPFFGMPEDAAILSETPAYDAALQEHGMPDAEVMQRYMLGSMGDGSAPEVPVIINGAEPSSRSKEPHPDFVEKGTDIALGFMPHRGENRRTRRAAVANWVPPKNPEPDHGGDPQGALNGPVDADVQPPPTIPTRRELWLQRQKHRRGKLDPELRRLQRKALKKHGT